MIKFEEKDKCHWEDGCRADFFKELTAPYDVKTMQEFKAAIRAEVIDEFVDLAKEIGNSIDIMDIEDIAEELKAGDNNG